MSVRSIAGFGVVVAAVIALTAILGWWFLGLVVVAAIALHLIGRWVFGDDRRPDEIHYVRTADGWDLAIWRVRPKTQPVKPIPVLLQHGLGANQRNFDLDDRYSVAHYLARHGYDCWLPALRGVGPSAYRRWGYPDRWNITFEKFLDYDEPAIFGKILELTGASKLHFIGQSMGAMVGYALAEGPLGEKMQSLTAACGPCIFKHMAQFKPLLPLRKIFRPLVALHISFFAKMQAPIVRFLPRFAGEDEVNWRNMDPAALARAAANVVDDMPRDLLLQFGEWVEHADFGSHRGADSWEKNLHKITVPIYCFGGSADRFCAPPANNTVIDQVSSAKKQYRLFSTANGGMADYGHGDVVVGRTAPDEVFPTILDWVRQND
jgi:pimeloyl-ACP methyl ester carboxylesterase